MIEVLHLLQGIVERGLIFGMIVAAVYVASRLISFDNLAVEGAFGLGGAMMAVLLHGGINPWIGLGGALLGGSASGVLTALLHTKLRLNNLVSGIVVTTGLFSIILKIAGSNMIVSGGPTIFSGGALVVLPYQSLFVLAMVSMFVIVLITWFLKTEVGFLLRAVGAAPQMLTNIGKSIDAYVMLGLVISNALAALSGALFVQYTGYFSIWSGVGVLIIGLAGMMLAQAFDAHFGWILLIGSIIYQAVIAFTFELQLDQDWNKLITALLIIFLIVLKQSLSKR